MNKKIFLFLEKEYPRFFNYKQIAAQLGITDTEGKSKLAKKLVALREKKKIQEVSKGKYRANSKQKRIIGVVNIVGKNNAYIVCETLEEDVFIPFKSLNKAFHGDKVVVRILPKRGKGKLEGEIIEILEREKINYIGIIQKQKEYSFVISTDPKMYVDFFVPNKKLGDANDGDKVLVALEDWPISAKSPYGKIIKTLGKPGEHDTEIHAILAEYGLPYAFPPEVEHYANTLNTKISKTEIAKRKDMRQTLTFTIDPRDAKDFDDALSFKKLKNGNYEIGIHIADVSHYVIPETPLDKEAYKRATSVYLVDRVVPMLPEILSNKACSLRPKEEKYTFSTIFEITPEAQLVAQWIGKTVISSDIRFAYEEVQHLIETEKGEIPKDISIKNKTYTISNDLLTAVLTLHNLAKIFRQQRKNEGAISFEKIEVGFLLDQQNIPTELYFKESKEANQLIEEFMLLANRKVAEFIGKRKPMLPFVYRIHEPPDEDKLIQLRQIVNKFGYQIDLRNKKSIAHSLNTLLQAVKGKKEQHMVDTLTIRSMSKAAYSLDNIGHYGLSFDYYTHFTSPIRRYPDVMVHRLLEHYLKKDNGIKSEEYTLKCTHCSKMETVAVNAERSSIKYMQIKFMENYPHQEFLGVISGVTQWGIYVEIIENKCEGMVSIKDIKDDYYQFDEKQYALVGKRYKTHYQLGDEVIVAVKNTDLTKRHLDFYLIGKID